MVSLPTLPHYEASTTFSLQDYPFHFLCDGQSLEHEELREFVDFVFCQGEDEVVLAVSAKCQRAVVLAEQRCVVDAPGSLGDVDVAVAHRLHLAGGHEGLHLHRLGGFEIEDVQSALSLAEGHHAVDIGDSLVLELNVYFHNNKRY